MQLASRAIWRSNDSGAAVTSWSACCSDAALPFTRFLFDAPHTGRCGGFHILWSPLCHPLLRVCAIAPLQSNPAFVSTAGFPCGSTILPCLQVDCRLQFSQFVAFNVRPSISTQSRAPAMSPQRTSLRPAVFAIKLGIAQKQHSRQTDISSMSRAASKNPVGIRCSSHESFLVHRPGPNNSFKPKPLRGSA